MDEERTARGAVADVERPGARDQRRRHRRERASGWEAHGAVAGELGGNTLGRALVLDHRVTERRGGRDPAQAREVGRADPSPSTWTSPSGDSFEVADRIRRWRSTRMFVRYSASAGLFHWPRSTNLRISSGENRAILRAIHAAVALGHPQERGVRVERAPRAGIEVARRVVRELLLAGLVARAVPRLLDRRRT